MFKFYIPIKYHFRKRILKRKISIISLAFFVITKIYYSSYFCYISECIKTVIITIKKFTKSTSIFYFIICEKTEKAI